MATTIKLYTADENLNAITKTISNVNPVASDYVLKNFGVQLMNLSDNTLNKVERVETKDITSATDDYVGITITTTSPFASADHATFKDAVDDLDSSGTLSFDLTQSASDGAQISIADLKNWTSRNSNFNAESFATIVNQRLFDLQAVAKNAEFKFIPNQGFKLIITNSTGGSYRITITGDDTGAYAFIDSLYDGADTETKSYFSGSAGNRKLSKTVR